LLRTKIHRPSITADLVPRPRLLNQLNLHRQRPLIVISAGAGYGKTTLISSWLEASDWPHAWLSLGEDDNDLVVFLVYFLAAVQTIFPQAGEETLGLLHAATLPPLPVIARSLINELDQIEQPFILVLDDYHHIRELAVHDLLNELLRYPPQALRLVWVQKLSNQFQGDKNEKIRNTRVKCPADAGLHQPNPCQDHDPASTGRSSHGSTKHGDRVILNW
jgi:LuxR family maltose regulon positive regulatory protein